MLTPERAKEELKRYHNPAAREELSSRLHSLPKDVASVGLAFFEGAVSGHARTNPEARRKRLEAHEAVEKLEGNERRKLFAALFPPVPEYVEASWQLQTALPYQTGFVRRAFRAPQNPSYSARARAEWLEALLQAVLGYRYDLDFLTVWAPYLRWGAEHPIGLLLAAVLDTQCSAGDETFHNLIAIVNGKHEIGRIGRYVITALLSCSNPEAWVTVERLLLAAQRQEGLRQVVMESIDFAHPEAYRRMLRLILQEKLARFAAVARGIAVWFGFSIDSADTKLINAALTEILENLSDDSLRAQRIKSAKNQTLYFALWAAGFLDVVPAISEAKKVAQEPDFERRYAAVHFISQLGTSNSARLLVDFLSDPDLRIAIRASETIPGPAAWVQSVETDVFAALSQLAARTPQDKLLEPAIWEWNRVRAKQSDVAAKLVIFRGERSFEDLAAHISQMDPLGRAALLRALQQEVNKAGKLEAGQRDLAFSLLSDASNTVRELAFQVLQHAQISPREAEAIELLLARKASDLRRGVIRLLLSQPSEACGRSIERLANSGDPLMQQAAEELRSELDPQSVPAADVQHGFGLFDPAQRTRPVTPRADLRPQLVTPASEAVLKSLEGLIEKHRESAVTITGHYGETISELLGNLRYFGQGEDFPLWSVWADWWRAEQANLGDTAEAELVRAYGILTVLPSPIDPTWKRTIDFSVFGIADINGFQFKFQNLSSQIVWRLLVRNADSGALTLLLDVMEAYARVTSAAYSPTRDIGCIKAGWQTRALNSLSMLVERIIENRPDAAPPDFWTRYWPLIRFIDEGVPDSPRKLPPLLVTLQAHRQSAASEADIYDQLLAKQKQSRGDLWRVTTRKRSKLLDSYPELEPIVENCRKRILAVELKRGDLPTPATPFALDLRSIFGAELTLTILKQLGEDVLERGYLRLSESKSVAFSHLLRVSVPDEQDTPESFGATAKRLEIPRRRLIDLAIYAPQWACYVEHATGIAGLEDAALWLHAHTKDTQWTVDEQIRELWFSELSERTLLSRQELLDGAVDVSWFHKMRTAIKDKEWAMLLDSAKYASGGAGHKRAELFASALSGEVTREHLSRKLIAKRNQDGVRAIGLLPLPPSELEGRSEILVRYELLQQFLRESNKFGAQRQASEKLAYTIGLENLARTAGYPDPQRLSWTMEAEASADLRSGPIEMVDGEVRAVLSINALGEPELAFDKNGKALKDIPAALRKSPVLSAMRTRKSQLLQQTSRIRQSLEEAMIRGDSFTSSELRELQQHPLLKPMLASLVVTTEDHRLLWGNEVNGTPGAVRIAHPVDLLHSGRWSEYQKRCLELACIQPFKQTFRELYLLTEPERRQQLHSSRYDGQQVNPKQAITVVGKLGWINVPEEGLRKTYHYDNVSAWVTFLQGWLTPAEVDGLTVRSVFFTRRSDGKPIPLDQVHPRVFSEAMRDLDLMVSVAHCGGVDPEATASTIEMRAALICETMALLKVTNVRVSGQHAFVDGKMGQYNVHLGSGVVHRQPGSSLCIIPVHSQHRGRIFLPFADNDPKTAEVISKVLLLAQDEKIKDPTILEQLR